MLTYQRNLLRARVNTVIGSLFIGSWALGCGLIMWQASFDENPIAAAFVSVIPADTLERY